MMVENSYIGLLKSNIVFGGIRFFQIVINVLKTKVFAILLGASGMGIQVLLNTALQTIHQFTTFGIYKTSVRDISCSTIGCNTEKKVDIIRILHTYVTLFAILGALICICFSSTLSNLIFNTPNYKVAFIILAFGVIFEAFVNDFISIFQGLRKVRELAKASLIGAILSLLVVIPILYFWREDGIPYAIVVSYFSILLVYYIFYKKYIHIKISRFATLKELMEDGNSMLKMGTLLMVSSAVFSLLTLIVNSIINHYGGIQEVGFYSAANNCTYGNIIIFTSILNSDFYPRLAALQFKPKEFNLVFNQQIELLLLVLLPITCLFIVFAKEVVLLLYSKDFLDIVTYVRVMAISLLLRIVWQACSMVILSYGKQKIYLIYDAVIANGGFFIINIIAYLLYGLLGLCYSCVISSIIITFILAFTIKKNFDVHFSKNVIILLIISILMVCVSYLISEFIHSYYSIVLSGILLILSLIVSLTFLNKRLNILYFIRCRLKR